MYLYPPQAYTTPVAPASGVFAMGVAGALITATSTAARGVRDVQSGLKTRQEAVNTVVKESLGAGLAVAAGAAVGKTLFRSGPACLLTMLAVGVGAKYVYDGMVDNALRAAAPAEETARNKTPKKA